MRRARRLAKALKRARRRRGRPHRHARLERLPPFRDLLWRLRHGRGLHTINPRLFPEQIVYIVNHAEDRFVFFDLTFAPLVAKLKPHCPGVRGWVAMTDRAHLPKDVPDALVFEELIAAESDDFDWPRLDEDAASSLCYTSGTTGNPKGVLFSHRSTVLHSYGAALPDAMKLSARDVVMPVVPMFHANAWGLPYACPLVGAKIVFPGAALDGKSLFELFEGEKVTFSGGVPTVWLGLLAVHGADERTASPRWSAPSSAARPARRR